MSDKDVIASVVEDQNTGQINDSGVGQDEGAIQQENSTEDWQSQAKYFQSEKDKLHVENQQLKQYEKIGKFLESRPDLVQNLMSEVGGQPKAQQENIKLNADEFDPFIFISSLEKSKNQEIKKTIGKPKSKNKITNFEAHIGSSKIGNKISTN